MKTTRRAVHMNSLNVVVAAPAFDESLPHADDETLRRIANVSSKVRVTDASAPMMAEIRGEVTEKEKLDRILAEAEVIFGLLLPRNLLSRAPKLEWIQMMSAGVDRLRETDIWQTGVTITGVSGIHASPIGEFVLGLMLMFAKGMTQSLVLKQKHEWRRYMPTLLRDKTVGIVGLGHIGSEVARLSKVFGMKVIATRRSARKSGKAKNVDALLPSSQMEEILAESDYVVLCLPLTSETRHIIGENEFRSMKPGSRIINIGRGDLIDEEALIRALDEKRIAGAGLDVTAIEPLPPDSPLWDMENVILSPHVSGGMEGYMAEATELFCDNIRRYLEGKRLRNVIGRKKGY
jgi:D-2-hydroxyacid dehydrogenase (NADP+)